MCCEMYYTCVVVLHWSIGVEFGVGCVCVGLVGVVSRLVSWVGVVTLVRFGLVGCVSVIGFGGLCWCDWVWWVVLVRFRQCGCVGVVMLVWMGQ